MPKTPLPKVKSTWPPEHDQILLQHLQEFGDTPCWTGPSSGTQILSMCQGLNNKVRPARKKLTNDDTSLRKTGAKLQAQPMSLSGMNRSVSPSRHSKAGLDNTSQKCPFVDYDDDDTEEVEEDDKDELNSDLIGPAETTTTIISFAKAPNLRAYVKAPGLSILSSTNRVHMKAESSLLAFTSTPMDDYASSTPTPRTHAANILGWAIWCALSLTPS
ncbi:hypothetical protein BC829DRAFT_446401 [Chytridium lagenaria]|nr:hypothetical protein BC829DRAFT_446401 [Chytridium lagenaria]